MKRPSGNVAAMVVVGLIAVFVTVVVLAPAWFG